MSHTPLPSRGARRRRRSQTVSTPELGTQERPPSPLEVGAPVCERELCAPLLRKRSGRGGRRARRNPVSCVSPAGGAWACSTKSHDGKVKTVVTGHTGSTYRDRETPRPRDATPAPARTEPGLTGQVHRGTRTLKDAHGARTHDIQRGQARRPCPSVACAHARALRCTLRPTITTPLAHAPSLSLACSCASVIARDGA